MNCLMSHVQEEWVAVVVFVDDLYRLVGVDICYVMTGLVMDYLESKSIKRYENVLGTSCFV